MAYRRSPYCVVLIDMQVDFIPKLRPGAKDRIVPHQLSVLALCAKCNIPVVTVELVGYGETIPELQSALSLVRRHFLYRKTRDDAFSLASFENRLEKLRPQSLILLGINAAFCVLATAESAVRKKYSIVTSPDLIAGQSNHPSDDCRDWYQTNGSLLPSIAEVCALLEMGNLKK